MTDRLSLAIAGGYVPLPDHGTILLLAPPGDLSLAALPVERCLAVQRFRPDYDRLAAQGLAMATEAEDSFVTAVVFAARAKAMTLDLLAQACTAVGPGGLVVVDGAKGDGIDSIVKRVRAVAEMGEVFAKSHGKCFVFTVPDEVPADWPARATSVQGYATAAGVFSADGVDPGSALLAEEMGTLSGRICDLGAGWGYLSSIALRSAAVTEISLVEADHAALACARENIDDPRASFHWADATVWDGGPFDVVISNPPFHVSRKADPAIGRAFVARAAHLLTPRGRLLLVANRHLPYEATLAEAFAEVVVRADTAGYKVIEAKRPKRRKP